MHPHPRGGMALCTGCLYPPSLSTLLHGLLPYVLGIPYLLPSPPFLIFMVMRMALGSRRWPWGLQLTQVVFHGYAYGLGLAQAALCLRCLLAVAMLLPPRQRLVRMRWHQVRPAHVVGRLCYWRLDIAEARILLEALRVHREAGVWALQGDGYPPVPRPVRLLLNHALGLRASPRPPCKFTVREMEDVDRDCRFMARIVPWLWSRKASRDASRWFRCPTSTGCHSVGAIGIGVNRTLPTARTTRRRQF